mgnify:CR=1 FL=1
MIDAPEKIWAVYDEDISQQTYEITASIEPGGFVDKPTRYVRADLISTWQLIESAPKDQPFLCAHIEDDCGVSGIEIAWFEGFFDHFIIDTRGPDHFIEMQATHWMPLPSPPVKEDT